MADNPVERRSESRKIVDEYYSVEVSIEEIASVYRFKIWDMSSKGLCIVVKKDSALIGHLKVGDILDMKYYTTDSSRPGKFLRTKVVHITSDEPRFAGQYLVGISVLEG
ncbi:MAG: PilZ domain-containing protein [Desulfatiglans sp.]|jgi:hypothetical protein|nr:PilZ domain-containing protein [Thermodesulfobacteriota bacterium]MEE4352645.1 PilZ domain-containing protein [Desulfatiglans sp.]